MSFWTLLSTGRVGKSIAVQSFLPTRLVDTGARYTLSVVTARQHGPKYGSHFGHPLTRAVETGRQINTGVQNDEPC